ncbi:MAG: GFA family protein [Pseudomonadota bacterium]
MTKRSGQCLCGTVRLSASLPETTFLACHCGQCRRWTGGGPLYAIRAEGVEITGSETIEEFKISAWGARGFCRLCGTTLYWKMQDRGIDSLAVGLLDDQSGLSLTDEIFSDCRAPWMRPIDGASQSTEAQENEKLVAYLNAREAPGDTR